MTCIQFKPTTDWFTIDAKYLDIQSWEAAKFLPYETEVSGGKDTALQYIVVIVICMYKIQRWKKEQVIILEGKANFPWFQFHTLNSSYNSYSTFHTSLQLLAHISVSPMRELTKGSTMSSSSSNRQHLAGYTLNIY